MGVPDFFDELHALSHREPTNVVEGKACHAESLRDSTLSRASASVRRLTDMALSCTNIADRRRRC